MVVSDDNKNPSVPEKQTDNYQILGEKNIDDFESMTENQYQLFLDETNQKETEECVEENINFDNTISIEKEEREKVNIEILSQEKKELKENFLPEENGKQSDLEEREKISEPKTVIIDFDKKIGRIDTAIDIKYSSLGIKSFPIKFSNIPQNMEFLNETVLGTIKIRIGNQKINNCHLTIFSNENIKILKIKHREFTFIFSIVLTENKIVAFGGVREYKISSKIKSTRMLKVLEMFRRIFAGERISFICGRIVANVVVLDKIELERVETLLKFFDTLKQAQCKFEIQNFLTEENIYSLLELYATYVEKRVIETWCNFNLENNNLDVNIGDSLVFERKHIFDANMILVEKITLKNIADKKSIFKNKIVGWRKQCFIEVFRGE